MFKFKLKKIKCYRDLFNYCKHKRIPPNVDEWYFPKEIVKGLCEENIVNNTFLIWIVVYYPSELPIFLPYLKKQINIPNSYGYTPLIIASRINIVENITLLLKYGANVNYVRQDHLNALMMAILNNNPSIAQILIEHDSNINLINNKGNTPLLLAITQDLWNIASLLVKYGANINVINEDYESPLSLTSKCNPKFAIFLIENGADIDVLNEDNKTPLIIACENNHIELVQVLLNKGCNVNQLTYIEYENKKDEKYSALHLTTIRGYYDITKLLIEYGANIDEPDEYCDTPLKFATNNGHFNIVKLLVEHGANLFSLNDDNMNAYDVAKTSGNDIITQYLYSAMNNPTLVSPAPNKHTKQVRKYRTSKKCHKLT